MFEAEFGFTQRIGAEYLNTDAETLRDDLRAHSVGTYHDLNNRLQHSNAFGTALAEAFGQTGLHLNSSECVELDAEFSELIHTGLRELDRLYYERIGSDHVELMSHAISKFYLVDGMIRTIYSRSQVGLPDETTSAQSNYPISQKAIIETVQMCEYLIHFEIPEFPLVTLFVLIGHLLDSIYTLNNSLEKSNSGLQDRWNYRLMRDEIFPQMVKLLVKTEGGVVVGYPHYDADQFKWFENIRLEVLRGIATNAEKVRGRGNSIESTVLAALSDQLTVWHPGPIYEPTMREHDELIKVEVRSLVGDQ